MKYIKNYELFEGVIKPYNFDKVISELNSIDTITKEDIERIMSPLDVEFVNLDYFKSKLQTEKEIKLVPERPLLEGIRFAAFNYYTNKMYMCVIWNIFLKDLNSGARWQLIPLIKEILKHESIHKQQDERRKDKITIRHLEDSPQGSSNMIGAEKKELSRKYFSSTDEVMAYAQSFIDQCRERRMSDEDILKQMSRKSRPISWIEDIYKNLPSGYDSVPDEEPVKSIESGKMLKKTSRYNPKRRNDISRENALKRFKKYVYQYLQEDK